VNWYSTGYYVLKKLDWGVVMTLSIESNLRMVHSKIKDGQTIGAKVFSQKGNSPKQRTKVPKYC